MTIPSSQLHLSETERASLKKLLAINIDSNKGFEHAAKIVEDPSLQTFFNEMAATHLHNADELRRYVTISGEDPHTGESFSNRMHRWWLDLRQTVAGGGGRKVLEDAETGEGHIIHCYEEELEKIGDTDVRETVSRQYHHIREDHDKVRSLRDQYRNPV